MGREIDFMVAPLERESDVPDWFKEFGIKQCGLRLWQSLPEPEMRELVYRTTGKRGKQLRRYFERQPLQPRYYVCMYGRYGKLERPFAMDKASWDAMPWVA